MVAFGVGFAVVGAVALAVQSLAVRASTRTSPVAAVIATVFLVNVAVLLPVTALFYFPAYGLSAVAITAFAAGGILGSLLARTALFVAIDRLGASRAEPLKSTFPLVAVVAAVVVLDEPLTPALLAGVVLLVAGAALVSRDARASPVTASGRQAWIDLGYPLAAALLLGIDPVFTSVGLAEGTPPLVGVTVRVLTAASVFGLYRLWRRRGQERDRGSWRPGRWALVAGLANTAYLVAYLAALDGAPVSLVAPILGASPLLVVVGAAILPGSDERVTIRLGVAVAVLVCGVVLVVSG